MFVWHSYLRVKSREFQLVAPERTNLKWNRQGIQMRIYWKSCFSDSNFSYHCCFKMNFGMLLSPLSPESCCLVCGGLQLSFSWNWNYRQLRATSRRWQEQNPSPLQKQQAFSGAEPSLQRPNLFLRIWRRLSVSSFPHRLLSYVASFLRVSAWIC